MNAHIAQSITYVSLALLRTGFALGKIFAPEPVKFALTIVEDFTILTLYGTYAGCHRKEIVEGAQKIVCSVKGLFSFEKTESCTSEKNSYLVFILIPSVHKLAQYVLTLSAFSVFVASLFVAPQILGAVLGGLSVIKFLDYAFFEKKVIPQNDQQKCVVLPPDPQKQAELRRVTSDYSISKMILGSALDSVFENKFRDLESVDLDDLEKTVENFNQEQVLENQLYVKLSGEAAQMTSKPLLIDLRWVEDFRQARIAKTNAERDLVGA